MVRRNGRRRPLGGEGQPGEGQERVRVRAALQDAVIGMAVELGARDPEELAGSDGRMEVHLVGDERELHQGRRYAHQGRLAGNPAGDAVLDVRDPAIQEGCLVVCLDHPGGDEGGADQQPGDVEASGPAGGAVRRRSAVPGRRQPLHAALLGCDRRLDEGHRCPESMPADRIAGDQVALP